MVLWLALACSTTEVVDDSGDAPPDTADTAGDTDTGEPPRDLDADGYPAGEDCMDLNAAVHPGATEVWNGLDDDCDGVFDADGDWTGELDAEATAVYEGRPYAFDVPCAFSGTRSFGEFAWTIECTPEPADDDAQLMLGERLTLVPEDPTVDGQAWSGAAILASTNGWDTDTDAQITWSAFDAATLSVALDAFSLDFSVAGAIRR